MGHRDGLGRHTDPAEGEVTVRSYALPFCASLLLGIQAAGVLWVTNRRLIFEVLGAEDGGPPVVHREVQLRDVSAVTCSRGSTFIIGRFGFALLECIQVAALAPLLLPLVGATIYVYPGPHWTAPVKQPPGVLLAWVMAIAAFGGSLVVSRAHVERSILACAAASIVAALAGYTLMPELSEGTVPIYGAGKEGPPLLLASLLAIYGLGSAVRASRRPTIWLAIHARAGSSTPGTPRASAGNGLFTTGAQRGLRAVPGEGMEALLRELGAIVLDLQLLGEDGVRRWIPHPERSGGEPGAS